MSNSQPEYLIKGSIFQCICMLNVLVQTPTGSTQTIRAGWGISYSLAKNYPFNLGEVVGTNPKVFPSLTQSPQESQIIFATGHFKK